MPRGRFFLKKRRKTSKKAKILEISKFWQNHLKAPWILYKKGKIHFFDGTNGFPSRWPNRSKIVKFDLPPIFRLPHRECRTTQIKQLSFFSSPGTYLWLIQKKKFARQTKNVVGKEFAWYDGLQYWLNNWLNKCA